MENLRRKAKSADKMFSALVAQMRDASVIERTNKFTKETEFPPWL
jgi:hypothetical protein